MCDSQLFTASIRGAVPHTSVLRHKVTVVLEIKTYFFLNAKASLSENRGLTGRVVNVFIALGRLRTLLVNFH